MKKDILTAIFVFLFCSIFMTSNSFGQGRTHEIGVRFQSVDSREFIYKRSSIENRFMRYRVGNASLTNVIGQGTNVANFSLAFAIGRESRKRISALYMDQNWEWSSLRYPATIFPNMFCVLN